MIKLVKFTQHWKRSVDSEDCVVLQRNGDSNHIAISFPFYEDTPNFTMHLSEALSLRNAIDDLVAIKMLGEPEQSYTVEDFKPTHIAIGDQFKLVELMKQYQLHTDRDQHALRALQRVFRILGIKENGGN